MICNIPITLFQAKQFKVSNLSSFYKSSLFKKNDFFYDSKRKIIIQNLPAVEND